MKTTGSLKLAERYVKALFDVASKASALPAVEKDLQALLALAEGNAEFSDFLKNPLLTRDQSAKAMDAMLAKIGAHDVTRKFAAMLAAQKRLPVLPDIASLFAEVAAKARGEISAELISASEVKAPEVAAVAEKLGKVYGKKVAVKTRVNPELMGGVVVKIGSTQLDSSIAGKMQRLKNALKAA